MRELLPILPRPSRYLGCEWGAVVKDPAVVRCRVALAFPDLYEVGMSYVGQRILYGIVNARPDMWAERVYSPDREAAEVLRSHGARLATLESDTALAELDAVAFHVTHEMCYTNVLFMLDLAGLPLRTADRPEWPLVMAGGGVAFNAEPLAPFLDLMVLGDGEEALPAVLERLAQAREAGQGKREFLESLRGMPGMYVPAFFEEQEGSAALRPVFEDYTRVDKAVVRDLGTVAYPEREVLPLGKAVHDRFSMEIARGCTRGCRFCHAGMVYRPVRERGLERLGEMLERGLTENGYEEVSFLSLSTGDYSALDALFEQSFERCAAEQISISLPSLRVGSVSGKLMELMSRIRRTGATLAPEAGSQRLRDVINKGVTEEGLIEHVRRLYEHGWQQVKLYFMLGLPTETDDDLHAILDLCRKVVAAAGPMAKRVQVTAAVSPFVPKPHTPFQWEAQISKQEIERKVSLLRDLFRADKRLKLRWHEPSMSWLEGVFARGDRRLACAVERAYRSGALFDSWVDHLNLEAWASAFAECGIDPEAYLGARDPEAGLPWDHLNPGVSKRFLLTERKRAHEGKLTADCRYDACRNCGVCAFEGRTSTLGVEDLRPRMVFERRDQEPADVVDVADAAARGVAPAPARGGRPAPPRTRDELTRKAAHYRVWFAKTGQAAFLSTLEMQPLLERALRRAGIEPAFSQGFHPAPLVSFGRALPVGVGSLAEWFAVWTREDYDTDEVFDRLNEALPAGLRVTSVERLPVVGKVVQADVEDFVVRYTGPEEGVAEWRRAWERFIAARAFPVVKEGKKGPREIDLRPIVVEAEIADDRRVALRLDWRAAYVSPLFLVRSVAPEAGLQQLEVLKIRQIMNG